VPDSVAVLLCNTGALPWHVGLRRGRGGGSENLCSDTLTTESPHHVHTSTARHLIFTRCRPPPQQKERKKGNLEAAAMAPSSVSTAAQTWQKALDRLDPDLRTALASQAVNTNKSDIVSAILREADKRRQDCIRRQWTFTAPGGRVIVVRDVLEKVVSWVNRYKAVGDLASQFDPVNASLPWAAFRYLLEVATGDIQAFGLIITLLEAVARILARSRIIEELHIRGPSPTDLAQPLEDALVLLLADALVLLAKCVKYFVRPAASKLTPPEL